MSRLSLFLLTFFVSSYSFANDAPPAPSMLGQFIMIAIFLGIFYVMIIRPQNKKAQEHSSLLSKLSNGDEIITTGGILGKIEKISEQFVVINISDNVTLNMRKDSIADLLPKGTIKSI